MVVNVITLSHGKQYHWQLTFWNTGSPWVWRHYLSLEVGYTGKDQVSKKADCRERSAVKNTPTKGYI